MPVRFEFGVGVTIVYLGGKFAEVIRNLTKSSTKSVDVIESLDVLAKSLFIRSRECLTSGRCHFLNPVEHAGPRFMLAANVPLRDPSVEHLIEVVRVRVHENGLSRAAGRKVRDGGFAFHVLHRIHPNTKVGKKCLGKHLAQLVIDRRCAGPHAVAAAVATECPEEGTV